MASNRIVAATIFCKFYITSVIFCFLSGLPPPSVDIFDIFKNPKLSDEPLYVSDAEEKPAESDFDIFCRAMGWTSVEGVLRKKPPKKPRQPGEVRLDDLPSDIVHTSLLATDVAAELKTSVLKGIEKKHDLKQPSEREAYRARKVNCRTFLVRCNWKRFRS